MSTVSGGEIIERDRVTFDLGGGAQLRPLQQSQADELFVLTDSNRAYLRRWLPWLDGTRRVEDTRAFIHDTQTAWDAGASYTLALLDQGRVRGTVGLRVVDADSGRGEIGYWVAEDAQGRGLVTRACRSLLDFAFDDLRLRKVEIRCATQNRKSRAVPERLGLTLDRVVPEAEWLYDHWVDHAVYAVDVSSWRSGQSPSRTQED